jgi:glycosyltransferase involved in cell wall biosynthesis
MAQTPINLSLCMIAKNCNAALQTCLKSVRSWVDEVVMVDTGSTDDSPQIAVSFGAEVVHFPWCDDFAAARNESLRYARGDWIFWIDADETIDAENGRKLRTLATASSDDSPMAYTMRQRSRGPSIDGQADEIAIDQVRMFRNRPSLRFDRRIHEQIMSAVLRMGGRIAATDIVIEHSGYSDAECRRLKYERDLRLLELELAERPNDPFTLFNLGMTQGGLQKYEPAIRALKRCVSVAVGDEPFLRCAYALLVDTQSISGQLAAASETCQKGRALYPGDATLHFHQGLLAHASGRFPDAVDAFHAVLAADDEPSYSAFDATIRGWKSHQNLAIIHMQLGQFDLAETHWRKVLAEIPNCQSAQHGIREAQLRQGKNVDERSASEPGASAVAILLAPFEFIA